MDIFVGVTAVCLILVIVFVMFCRVFGITSVKCVTGVKGNYEGHIPDKRELTEVGIGALVCRIIIYIASFLLLKLVYMQDATFLEWWTKWDATNYIGIAEGGYNEILINGVQNMGDNVLQTLVFFPLYPVLVIGVNVLIGNIYVSALVTSTICFIAAIVFLYAAISKRYGKNIAEKSVTLISLSPFAFYYGGMLPESTFLLVTAMCMYFTIDRKWLLAGIAGALCGIARLQGILIIAFMGIEWLEEYNVITNLKEKAWKPLVQSMKKLVCVFMPLLGTAVYLLVNYIYTGDAFYFMKLQEYVWAHSYTDIFHSISIIWNQMITLETDKRIVYSVWFPQLFIFFAILILILVCYKRHRNSMSIYLLIYLIISYSTDYLISGTRYMSASIPLFVMLGEVGERKPHIYKWLTVACVAGMIIFMGCHVSGWNMVT